MIHTQLVHLLMERVEALSKCTTFPTAISKVSQLLRCWNLSHFLKISPQFHPHALTSCRLPGSSILSTVTKVSLLNQILAHISFLPTLRLCLILLCDLMSPNYPPVPEGRQGPSHGSCYLESSRTVSTSALLTGCLVE